MADTEIDLAIRTQEKFDFYLISLTFTLLALSIQTAKFHLARTTDLLELTGWTSLLISGVFGLWRMEFIPDLRKKFAQSSSFKRNIDELRTLKASAVMRHEVLATGGEQSIDDRIAMFSQVLDVLGPVIKNLERRNQMKYYVQRYAFLLGVMSLVTARAIPAVLTVRAA